MAILTLRGTKGSPLTNDELDANFTNINVELGQKLTAALYTADDVLAKVKSFPSSSSGLDAQFLRGRSAAVANTADTLVLRDSLGNFTAGTVFATLNGAVTSNNVNITGGNISGITDLAIIDGGTGASTAAQARSNLGLVIGTDVQAYSSALNAIAQLTGSADTLAYFTGANTSALTSLTSFARSLLDDSSASAMRNTLGIAIGTDVQPFSSELTALGSANSNGLVVRTGANSYVRRTITGSGLVSVTNGNGTGGDINISVTSDPTQAPARGYISFNSAGGVFRSKNLTVGKSSTGVFLVYLDPSIRTGNANYVAIVGSIDKGTTQGSSYNANTIDIYQVGITSYTSDYFVVRIFRRYNTGYVQGGGNDANWITTFGAHNIDVQRISVVVY